MFVFVCARVYARERERERERERVKMSEWQRFGIPLQTLDLQLGWRGLVLVTNI